MDTPAISSSLLQYHHHCHDARSRSRSLALALALSHTHSLCLSICVYLSVCVCVCLCVFVSLQELDDDAILRSLVLSSARTRGHVTRVLVSEEASEGGVKKGW